MRTGGVIAEFNPFHEGHRHLFRKIRESGCDHIVVLMSGDFVQRGECAICSKYERTALALRAGADLVLELPVAAALGSARVFAESAAAHLNALGVVDELWFGSEAGRIEPFLSLGRTLADKEEAFMPALQSLLKLGRTFPAARAEALAALPETDRAGMTPEALSDFLNGQNNILGLEYVRALLRLHSRIEPKTIARAGAGYLDRDKQAAYPSAFALRKAEKAGQSTGAFTQTPLFPDDFSLLLGAALLETDYEAVSALADISPDLARRICGLTGSFSGFTQYASLVKTRNLTYTHVSRALMRILLGISREEEAKALAPTAVRVLGLRDAPALFACIKEKSRIRLISSAREFHERTGGRDAYAANLYSFILSQKAGEPYVHEYTRKIVKISS